MKRTLIALLCTALLPIGAAWSSPSLAIADLPAVSVTAYGLERQQVTTETTILNVDPIKNTITITGPDQHAETVEVRADARKLDRLKPGDRVDTHYLRAVALQVMPANSAKPGVEYSGGTEATNEGNGSFIQTHYTENVTATLSAMDMANGTVTLTGDDGYSRIVDVGNLHKREDVSKLKVGDLVSVTYVEELAISLDPKQAR
ncbi:hypothetical protein DWU98_11380 [Dyella monticola]|uniref:DUF5666 domain-containing protein n=1 Tax=Dyella monticola TaxID=1927958 RepID=A0A370WYA8_9GAMM|nr:hypothetical protein [Dyella monticola]RDS81138.1 hypothetical protein DWU98_11380 [Dyella monticola]